MQYTDVIFEYLPCPCGEYNYAVILANAKDTLHNLEGSFNIVRCIRCDLVRTHPRPTPNTINYYYPEEYGPYKSSTETLSINPSLSSFKKFLINHFFKINDKCIPNHYNSGTLLEIGCASGSYLKKMHAEGWEVTGVEFSEPLAQNLRDQGFEMHGGSFDAIDWNNRTFDIITAWMVLEHMHDPAHTLRTIHSLLSNEGCFAFSVPDMSSIDFKLFQRYWYALQVPTHLFHFDPTSLTNLLKQNGFVVEKILWQQNPNNLLNSLILYTQHHNLIKISTFLQTGIKRYKIYRIFLGILGYLLKISHSSGRMTIWAKKAH